MTREELEKMFDDRFPSEKSKISDRRIFLIYPEPNKLKQFFFETMLPEVLRDLAPDIEYDYFKKNAKEFYNIDL